MLGKAKFSTIVIGDLVYWTDISRRMKKRRGLVLEKWIDSNHGNPEGRKIAMLRVVDFQDNQIINIYAINAKIESKSTT
jgi:hypothetical protein